MSILAQADPATAVVAAAERRGVEAADMSETAPLANVLPLTFPARRDAASNLSSEESSEDSMCATFGSLGEITP
jgi:hypothetical protein